MCVRILSAFLDDGATIGAFLAGIVRRNCNHGDIMQEAVSCNPLQEDAPTSIMNALRQFAVTDHVANLKVLIGNQVARRDIRVCLLAGKIFTLPLDFQMLLRQSLSGFLPVRRFLLFARESSLETFELRLSFAVVPWVIYRVSLGVGQKALQSDINTQSRLPVRTCSILRSVLTQN